MSNPIQITIIDDETQNASALAQAIEQAIQADNRAEQFNVSIIADVKLAILAIENSEIDVLISDKRMNGVEDGLVFARLVRASSNPNIPVILITRDIGAGAPSSHPVIVAATAAGFDTVIDKYNLENRGAEFLQVIDGLLTEKAEQIAA